MENVVGYLCGISLLMVAYLTYYDTNRKINKRIINTTIDEYLKENSNEITFYKINENNSLLECIYNDLDSFKEKNIQIGKMMLAN